MKNNIKMQKLIDSIQRLKASEILYTVGLIFTCGMALSALTVICGMFSMTYGAFPFVVLPIVICIMASAAVTATTVAIGMCITKSRYQNQLEKLQQEEKNIQPYQIPAQQPQAVPGSIAMRQKSQEPHEKLMRRESTQNLVI